MALKTMKQTIEAETLVGSAQGQALLRTEALVPGAGREAIEALLAEANLVLGNAEVQTDRVVLDGTAFCQAVYRQGEEPTLRALTAQASLSHAMEIDGAEAGMVCRITGQVEHVEAKYENGHMVFLVTVGLNAQVVRLSPTEVIASVEGEEGLEADYEEICSVKLAAEATADALLREQVSLPAALDARMALMEWGTVSLEDVAPDLGGVRVKGRVNAEVLISSGVQGRPVALLKYPLAFDQLIELPEWLSGDAQPEITIRSLATRVEQGEEGQDATLNLEAELSFRIRAYVRDCVPALMDAYATRNGNITVDRTPLSVCWEIQRARCTDIAKGTVLLSENAPGVGSVLAVRALPNISGCTQENGQSAIEGILELTILYMPGGSDQLASTQAELPFSIPCPCSMTDDAWVRVEALNAEANALMSDRLEVKVSLSAFVETCVNRTFEPVTAISEAEPVSRRPGIILFWPGKDDNIWTIGKRYNLPVEKVVEMNGGQRFIEPGKAMVLRI